MRRCENAKRIGPIEWWRRRAIPLLCLTVAMGTVGCQPSADAPAAAGFDIGDPDRSFVVYQGILVGSDYITAKPVTMELTMYIDDSEPLAMAGGVVEAVIVHLGHRYSVGGTPFRPDPAPVGYFDCESATCVAYIGTRGRPTFEFRLDGTTSTDGRTLTALVSLQIWETVPEAFKNIPEIGSLRLETVEIVFNVTTDPD